MYIIHAEMKTIKEKKKVFKCQGIQFAELTKDMLLLEILRNFAVNSANQIQNN